MGHVQVIRLDLLRAALERDLARFVDDDAEEELEGFGCSVRSFRVCRFVFGVPFRVWYSIPFSIRRLAHKFMRLNVK